MVRKKRTLRSMEKSFSGRAGKFIYLTKSKYIPMRSSWEVKFSEYLDSKNYTWYYEPFAYRLITGVYFPDFYVADTDEWFEVKGRMTKRAENKIKEFQEAYPNTKYTVLRKQDLQKLGIKI